jgi:hypothetical protein
MKRETKKRTSTRRSAFAKSLSLPAVKDKRETLHLGSEKEEKIRGKKKS